MNEWTLWDQDISPALEARHNHKLAVVRHDLLALAHQTSRELSAEDARRVAQQHGFEIGNWMGSVFRDGNWRCVNRKPNKATGTHGRSIQTYRPISEAA